MGRNRNPSLIALALLFAAALLLRATLPTGWMPTQTDDGVRVMLCSGKGAIELPLVNKDGKAPSGREDAPQDPCPYGTALAKAFDLPVPFEVEVRLAFARPEAALEIVTASIVAARGIRPPARGPPAIA